METFTAHILVGQGDIYPGGIRTDAQIFLSENGRPILLLGNPLRLDEELYSRRETVCWIPTVDHIMDDILLMISISLLAERPGTVPELDLLRSDFESCANLWRYGYQREFELYDLFTDEQRASLYKRNKMIISSRFSGMKIIVSLFRGSSLLWQLDQMKDYTVNWEICPSFYSREDSVESGKVPEDRDLEESIQYLKQRQAGVPEGEEEKPSGQ
jgi:hypothetical protein